MAKKDLQDKYKNYNVKALQKEFKNCNVKAHIDFLEGVNYNPGVIQKILNYDYPKRQIENERKEAKRWKKLKLRKNLVNRIKWSFKFYVCCAAISSLFFYGPGMVGKLGDKIENSQYMTQSREKSQKRNIFEEKVEKAMKDSYNITSHTNTGYYLDIDGDRKPDAYIANPPMFARGWGAGPFGVTEIKNK